MASVNHGKTARGDTSSFPNSRTKKFEKRSLEEFRIEKSEIFRSKFDDDDDRYDDDVEDRKRHRSEFR